MEKNKKLKEKPFYKAHAHTIYNYREVLASQTCGCCYCQRTFTPDMIDYEMDTTPEPCSSKVTVLCPYCGIDAVFGDASGYTPTPELLQEMYRYWFEL